MNRNNCCSKNFILFKIINTILVIIQFLIEVITNFLFFTILSTQHKLSNKFKYLNLNFQCSPIRNYKSPFANISKYLLVKIVLKCEPPNTVTCWGQGTRFLCWWLNIDFALSPYREWVISMRDSRQSAIPTPTCSTGIRPLQCD